MSVNLKFSIKNLFESDTNLDLSMQSDCEAPFVCFKEQKKVYKMNKKGVLHFFSDDNRCFSVLDNLSLIDRYNPYGIVEISLPLDNKTTMSQATAMINNKRRLSCEFQKKGYKILVNLDVPEKFAGLNSQAIPYGWKSFCTRGYSDNLNKLKLDLSIAKSICGNNNLLFVIYAGGRNVREFSLSNNCVYINPLLTVSNKSPLLESIETKELLEQISYDIAV